MQNFKQKKCEISGELSRREFIKNCSICAAGMAALSKMYFVPLLADNNFPQDKRANVKLVFAHPDPAAPNWPNIGYNFKGHIQEVQARLSEGCPEINFSVVTVTSGEKGNALNILKTDQNMDGYVVYLAGCLWGEIPETIAASGKPTIIADHLFAGSGEFLTSYAGVRRAGHKVIGISSSDINDLIEAVNCFECLTKLKHSNVLVVGRETDQQIEKIYGTKMVPVEFKEINALYQKVNSKDIEKCADLWIGNAEKVIEPSREEIERAAAIYLAMRQFMEEKNAQAITVNCLGGIYSGKLVAAYPCLGFMQLDNDGLVGACEADQRATLTKLLMTYLVKRPGYISDPVIDTSKNQIIYAHCVGPTKVFGPEGPANPYHLRDHSEDRKGACNRSLMPLGEMTTTILFDHNKKQVIFHQGKTVENVNDDRACRTKLAVEINGDIDKLLTYWDEWGWHRVTFFGDLKRPVYNIASFLGFEVVEEA